MKIKKGESQNLVEMVKQFIRAEKKEIDKFICGLSTEQKDILLLEILFDLNSESYREINEFRLNM